MSTCCHFPIFLARKPHRQYNCLAVLHGCMCKGKPPPSWPLVMSVTRSSDWLPCCWIRPRGWISCACRKQHLVLHQTPAPRRWPSRFCWRVLVCLYAHAEVMKWLVKGLGQMNWQDRGAPAINTVSRESISQYLWYVGDTFLLLKDQSMLVASAHSVKKDH